MKYIFRMLAGVLVNLWRVEQSVQVIAPFILSHRANNDGADPSVLQIRAKQKELSWNDLSIDLYMGRSKSWSAVEGIHSYLTLYLEVLQQQLDLCLK